MSVRRTNPNPTIRAMSPEQKTQYFAELGARGHANRLTLNRDEREALASAYRLLGDIARRHNLDTDESPKAA